VGAKEWCLVLPALPPLYETVTAHCSSYARFIPLFARLLQCLVLWSGEQFLVVFWLGFGEMACCAAMLLLLLLLLLKNHSFNNSNAISP
jgi:hypothetical protein